MSSECGPATCDGCCDPAGLCRAGSTNDSCGLGGATCLGCATEQACTLGVCVSLPPPDAGADGGVDAGAAPVRDVVGRYLSVQHLPDGGVVEGPFDLSAAVIAALVEVDGGYEVFPGAGDSMGTFRIPSVPGGRYLFRMGGSYLESDRSRLELREESTARPVSTRVASTTNPTTTTLRVTGLSAWSTQTDAFAMATPLLGHAFPSLQAYAPSAFVAGASNATLALNFAGRPLVEAAKGDVSFVVQQRYTFSGASYWGGAITGAQLPPYTQLDGANVTVDVALLGAPMLPTTTLPLGVDLAAFGAQVSRFPPSPDAPRAELSVHASPRPDLFNMGVFLWYGDVSAPTPIPSSMSFVSPFPTDWAFHGRVMYVADVPLTIPGATGPAWARHDLGVVDEVSVLFSGPVSPRLGPVEGLTLDGVPFDATRSGVGKTPRVAWTAPQLGSPTTYYLSIGRLGVSGGQVRLLASTVISTERTSVRIPEGVLTEGASHYLQVLAVSAPFDRVNFSTQRVPYAWSTLSSPVFTP